MAKTLADMTAEERANCVGMWALIEDINLAVIAEADETNTCVVTYPQWDGDSAVHLNEMVTPRFDLPRVWTPDGEPVDMSKEYGQCEIGGTPDGAFATVVYVDKGDIEYAPNDTPRGEVYRWVGEWEQDNE